MHYTYLCKLLFAKNVGVREVDYKLLVLILYMPEVKCFKNTTGSEVEKTNFVG